LPAEAAWSERAAERQRTLLDDVRRLGRGEPTRDGAALARELEALKADYSAAYAAEHGRLALGPADDDRRARLYRDARLAALDGLAPIELLPGAELRTWKQAATD